MVTMNTPKAFTIEDALCINVLADRAPVRLSADGRFLAYTIEDRSGVAVQEQVWVTNIDTGESRHVLPDAVSSYLADWSPIGPIIAFVADTGAGPRLWVYDVESADARVVCDAVLAPNPFHFVVPQWTPDGSGLVCALASRASKPGYDYLGERIPRKAAPEQNVTGGGVTVRCWESPRTEQACDAEAPPDRTWSTLARVGLADGSVTPLVEDVHCEAWSVSPDGRYVAYLELVGCPPGAILYRLCVVPASGGDARVLDPNVIEDYGVSFSWSPDSKKIAYCPNHGVAVVSVDDAAPRVLMPSEGIVDEFYEAPLWSPDGDYLLATKQASIWRIPVDGGDPVDLLPERGTVGVRGIAAPGGGPLAWSPDGESVVVELRNWKSGRIGLARISLTGRGAIQSDLSMHRLSDVPRYHMDICPARGLITFVRQSATQPPDVWATDADLASSRRITALNPHMDECQFSEPRLITWTGPDGREHRSAYFPPVGEPDQPHPVVFVVYEGNQSGFLSTFGSTPVLNVQLLTGHGYGVCLPDQVSMSQQNQAEALRGMLACAVQSVIDEGIADPARIGILGHSFGGYITNLAVTGMDCFAVAVSSTGFANYTSAHGMPTLSGDGSCADFVESGQPHMGVPPWEDPQRYIENSPVFALDRVTTPLLIVHGDQDGHVAQSWEMFNGLRRLGKPAALAIYQGEDHAQSDWRRPNVIDFWQRALAWFDRYLV